MLGIVAVSGGVDSMVIFDMLRREMSGVVVVAHFNHKTRPSADDDQRFVERICFECGVKCEVGQAYLGEGVSEEAARQARYRFFKEVVEKYRGSGAEVPILYMAHHIDDLVESVVINLIRGTGWRGLTPMYGRDSLIIKRPFLEQGWGRSEVLKYAAQHNINYRQDPTNSQDEYLRNRVRAKLTQLSPEVRTKLYHEMNILKCGQNCVRREIEDIIHSMIYSVEQYPRSWFTQYGNAGDLSNAALESDIAATDDAVILEIIRAILKKAGIQATRPQMLDFLRAIRTYSPGKKFNLPGDKLVTLYKTYFVL